MTLKNPKYVKLSSFKAFGAMVTTATMSNGKDKKLIFSHILSVFKKFFKLYTYGYKFAWTKLLTNHYI